MTINTLFKKGITLTITVLFIEMSVFPLSGTVMVEKSSILFFDSNTLFVGGIGPNNYSKIQHAIDNASDGDTVFVYNGTYYENVIVNKSIKLIGQDKRKTYISGNKSRFVVDVIVSFVTITGFTIYKRNGINLKSDHVTISENIINSSGACIFSWGSDNNISNNIISSDSVAMTLWGNSSYNRIIGNTINSHCYRGLTIYSSDNIIYENIFNNSRSSYGADIYLESSRNNIISNNTLISMDGESGDGIQLYLFCRNNIIEGNKIINYSDDVGIWLGWNSNNNIIKGNTLSNNSWGISIVMSKFNKIHRNNFIKNRRNALFAIFSLFNSWDGNYWNRPRLLPYPIIGRLGIIIPLWVNFDWHPAQEPYNY